MRKSCIDRRPVEGRGSLEPEGGGEGELTSAVSRGIVLPDFRLYYFGIEPTSKVGSGKWKYARVKCFVAFYFLIRQSSK